MSKYADERQLVSFDTTRECLIIQKLCNQIPFLYWILKCGISCLTFAVDLFSYLSSQSFAFWQRHSNLFIPQKTPVFCLLRHFSSLSGIAWSLRARKMVPVCNCKVKIKYRNNSNTYFTFESLIFSAWVGLPVL